MSTYHRYLITGAASGLGKAIAVELAKQHGSAIKICIADIHPQRGRETVELLQSYGVEARYCHCDITSTDEVAMLQKFVTEQWQGVDVVFNNAGVATGGSIQSESIAQWQWIVDVNLLGMVRVTQAFLPMFTAQGHGHFVNVASQAGLTPIPLMSSYNAVKSAVVSFSETMKLELSQQQIAVSVVCPSFFKTNLNESLRTSEPTVAALLNKWFERATMSTEEVASIVVKKVAEQAFLILTHKEGIRAYWLKKWLPSNKYLSLMQKRITPLLKKCQDENQD